MTVQLRAPEPPLRDEVIELRLLSLDYVPAFLEGMRDPMVANDAYSDRLAAEETAVGEYIARVPQRLATGDAVSARDGARRFRA